MPDIERYIGPILKAYAVWDVDKQQWHRLHSHTCMLLPGVWANPDDIIAEIKIPNYRIIDFDFSRQLPEDVIRVIEFGANTGETKNLLICKIRQLIEIHIFQNYELQRQLREAPHALGTGISTSHRTDSNPSSPRSSMDDPPDGDQRPRHKVP